VRGDLARPAIRYAPHPGERKPLHSSAIGKAMLSLETDDDIRRTLSIVGQPRVTANTLSDIDALIADIRNGREQGIFVTRGGNVADVMGIAMVVRLAGEPAGIVIGGPMPRMIEKEQICRDLLAAARDDILALELDRNAAPGKVSMDRITARRRRSWWRTGGGRHHCAAAPIGIAAPSSAGSKRRARSRPACLAR
jgi:hypothetical protein